jgi:hypothetical protein
MILLGTACLSSLALTGCGWKFSIGNDPLVITTQPANVTITAEENATFGVTAKDDVPVSYQWYQDGTAIAGATSNVYKTPSMPLNSNGASFSVSVSDGTVARFSSPAMLTVNPKTATLAFQPISNPALGAAPFSVSAASPSPGPIAYSVLSGPATISGAMVTVNGMGPVVLSASQLPSGDYAGATATTKFAVIQNVSLSPISPANLTMGPGSKNFVATATGGITNGLKWSASGGSLAGSTWTSPNTGGTYTITASSADDATKTVSTSVVISPPVITQQPVGGSFCPKDNVALAVSAKYAETYQWNLNGKALHGVMSPSYSTIANTYLTPGQYTVAVANAAGSVLSDAATVAVGSSIVMSPQSVTVANGQTGTFSTSMSGVGPFSYQWYFVPPGGSNGIVIPGATASSYTTAAMNGTSNGNGYYAVISDGCKQTLTTDTASLTVTGAGVPPTILVPPVGQTTRPGGAASFSVQATGTPALTYQWYWVAAGGGAAVPIHGATEAEYVVPNSATTVSNDQDEYYVVVANAYGQAASQRVTLSTGAGIQITQQPVSAYIQQGDSATYTVVATSTLPLTYQWFEAAPGTSAFQPVQGATSSSYNVIGATTSMSGSNLYVVVSNGATAPVQSNTASLFVGQLSSITPCQGDWIELGSAAQLSPCSYELTAPETYRDGEIVWPSLLDTNNLEVQFTITTANSSPTPADGFAVVLGDPALGATLSSMGLYGEGMGARGIPGLAIAFDVYQNLASPDQPLDPPAPYLGIGRGEYSLWENPYFNINTAIPALTLYGETISHQYILNLHFGYMTMTMDGVQVFSGYVSVPSAAYLYITASTGLYYEETVVSGISAIATP